MRDISKLHGMPTTTILYEDSKFTSKLWKGLFQGLGTQLNFYTNIWPDRENNSNTRIYVVYVCHAQAH